MQVNSMQKCTVVLADIHKASNINVHFFSMMLSTNYRDNINHKLTLTSKQNRSQMLVMNNDRLTK